MLAMRKTFHNPNNDENIINFTLAEICLQTKVNVYKLIYLIRDVVHFK